MLGIFPKLRKEFLVKKKTTCRYLLMKNVWEITCLLLCLYFNIKLDKEKRNLRLKQIIMNRHWISFVTGMFISNCLYFDCARFTNIFAETEKLTGCAAKDRTTWSYQKETIAFSKSEHIFYFVLNRWFMLSGNGKISQWDKEHLFAYG